MYRGINVPTNRTPRFLCVCLALALVAAACGGAEGGGAPTTEIVSAPTTTSGPTTATTSGPTTAATSGPTTTIAVDPTTATSSPATETTGTTDIENIILAAGELNVSSVASQEELGYHGVLTATNNLPSDLGSTAGLMLVIRLWDASRPEQTCDSDHPTSGCVTVDWGDWIERPSVPPGGVFDNSISFDLVTGEQIFFLSESGALNDQPDALEPET